MEKMMVIGAGLAGCEAAWQLAIRGIQVDLFEMRPHVSTGAHRTDAPAELVCSNSLGSNLDNRASGLLKSELRRLGSLLMDCADQSSLPAGGALAVDRTVFSQCVLDRITAHPHINLIREEITEVPDRPAIIATGPLTSPALAASLAQFTGESHLYFFDALAPIVHRESIDMSIAFIADRYGEIGANDGDYLNCPLTEQDYDQFRKALIEAERIALRDFEENPTENDALHAPYFQGCQPIEIIARQGEKSLVFGPMRPVGLTDPRTGRWPFAVVQLRQDNLAGDLYNLVGFQTNLTYPEQARVFRMIPGLENATFERFGQMHRNTFIASPGLLDENLAFRRRPTLYVTGQLAGVEGYTGNIASGWVAGVQAARQLSGKEALHLPKTTMIGALIHYITHAALDQFQPTKAMFGLLPAPDDDIRRSKKLRFDYYRDRSHRDLEYLIARTPDLFP